jgi:hypothetical protein
MASMVEASLRWPVGLDAIKSEFGDPAQFAIDDGLRVTDAWPSTILHKLPLPAPLTIWDGRRVSSISCHRLVASSLGSILESLHDAGFWQALEPYGGCYCWRPMRAGTKLSAHCWGIAIDLRIATCKLGTPGDMPQGVIEAFTAQGWRWGGDWVRKDPQHFQACAGY